MKWTSSRGRARAKPIRACGAAKWYRFSMDRTDYRCNLEYRAAVRAEMLAVVRRLLAGDVGIIQAARSLSPFRDRVEPEIGSILDVFVGIHSETEALPIGEERALWNRTALEREDVKISAAERHWHGQAVEAAAQLVRMLEASQV